MEKSHKPVCGNSDCTVDHKELRKFLLSYGYYEQQPRGWLKPVGFHLFVFNEEKLEWSNVFLGGTGKFDLWEKKTLSNPEDIKHFEAYTRINVSVSAEADFRTYRDFVEE